MSYAIISVGGKQYRVREGERLLVDRLPHDEGKTFHPALLLVGGNGDADLGPKGVTVTARVVQHVLGEKVRIGKYRPKSGYRRHTGFRSRLSQIEIEAIGSRKAAAKPKAEAAAKPKAEAAAKPKAEAAAKPKAEPARKPRAKAAEKPKAKAEEKPKAAEKKTTTRKAAAKPKTTRAAEEKE